MSQFSFFNTDVTFSNSAPSANIVTLDGATTNGIANKFAFYNALPALKNTNAIGLNTSITLAASTFTISNNLALTASNTLNFILGTNAATLVVNGNLSLDGTNNIFAGNGFKAGSYTLMTYTGTLSGSPALGSTPAGFTYAFDTSTAQQVNLIVSPPAPATPTNLTTLATNLAIGLQWSAATGAASYNLKRSTTNGGAYSTIANVSGTNFSDTGINPGIAYYYVVSATNAFAESGNSVQASAIPLPSLTSAVLTFQPNANQLQLSWPADHLGWHLQIQTNGSDTGLGTNWTDLPDTVSNDQFILSVEPTNSSVFLRLVYP